VCGHGRDERNCGTIAHAANPLIQRYQHFYRLLWGRVVRFSRIASHKDCPWRGTTRFWTLGKYQGRNEIRCMVNHEKDASLKVKRQIRKHLSMCHLILFLPVLALPLFWLVPLSVAIPVYSAILVVWGWMYYFVIRVMRRPVVSGTEALLHEWAEVVSRGDNQFSAYTKRDLERRVGGHASARRPR